MILQDCPQPAVGPVPCPSTVDQHLTNIQKILPRGVAWLSAFDPLSAMYGYFRAIATTYQWANDQFCEMLLEMFCATRNFLTPDYLIEFGLPNPCNPNLDPCAMKPVFSAHCADLHTFLLTAGWNANCVAVYQNSSLCAVSGCASSGSGSSAASKLIAVSGSGSSSFNPGISASSGLAASGITVSGCENAGPGTFAALHCLIDSFLPAHVQFTLMLVA